MTAQNINSTQHSFITRLCHMSLATTIILQLLTSQFMTYPKKDRPGDWLFEIHEYCGMAALGLSLCFLLVILSRRSGTELGMLFPWFSAARLQALQQDLMGQWRALKELHLPTYHVKNPLASAVHGLGLILITIMAITGGIYFLALNLNLTTSYWVGLDKDLHESLGGIVWIYLIVHVGISMVHHFAQHFNLLDMWSLGRSKR